MYEPISKTTVVLGNDGEFTVVLGEHNKVDNITKRKIVLLMGTR